MIHFVDLPNFSSLKASIHCGLTETLNTSASASVMRLIEVDRQAVALTHRRLGVQGDVPRSGLHRSELAPNI